MKKKHIVAGLVSTALLITLVSSVHADPVAVSDAELDAVSGKAGSSFESSDALDISLSQIGTNQSSSVQWGVYQWFDSHTTDGSQAKGGNRFDGDLSSVQSTVTAINNSIFWGSLGQSAINTGKLDGGSNVAHATMSVGGF